MAAAANGRRFGTGKGVTAGRAAPLGAADRRMQRLADQAEIREGLERYFYAIDAGRYALFRKVFTDDARADYAGGKLKLRGWRGIMEGMRAILRGMRNSSSNHFITATEISVKGDTAVSDTFGAIFVTQGGGVARTLTAMGVRYRDDWVRGREGWRIRYRRHDRLWTCEDLPAGVVAKVAAKATPRG
jgi:hypothetical protein